MTWDLQKHRFMVSQCGKVADFFDIGSLPTGYTDCTDMDDDTLRELLYLRAKKNAGFWF